MTATNQDASIRIRPPQASLSTLIEEGDAAEAQRESVAAVQEQLLRFVDTRDGLPEEDRRGYADTSRKLSGREKKPPGHRLDASLRRPAHRST